MKNERLLTFVQGMSRLLQGEPHEPLILEQGGALLADLVKYDDWLPEAFARPA